MIKYPSFLVVFLMIFTAVSLYQIKHFITKKEIELAETNKAIKTTQSDLYILQAELSYLKRPDRLEQIAKNKLNMKDVLPIDIWNLKDLVDATKTFNESRS
ncbi:cell division protein FtsL [Alphaproteobacteria bacterium]|jgi:cell division protein FtsL|nr:cell division protein FtsL [Alphaproteobacteria bacterium]